MTFADKEGTRSELLGTTAFVIGITAEHGSTRADEGVTGAELLRTTAFVVVTSSENERPYTDGELSRWSKLQSWTSAIL